MRAARLREELLMEQGGEPGLEELAARLRVEPEELAQAYDSCSEVESLHKIIYQGDGEGVSLRIGWRRKRTSRKRYSRGCWSASF